MQDGGNGVGFFIDESSLGRGKTVDRGLTRQPGSDYVLVALVIKIFACKGDGLSNKGGVRDGDASEHARWKLGVGHSGGCCSCC